MAERYRDHPALALWHVSNELGCHNARCYCDVSAAAFRTWLRDRYDDDVAQLNDAWGTAFWSQRYDDFEQVLPPRVAPAHANPTQQLDFARFSSDQLLDNFVVERDVLHRLSPGVPVTTNFMVMRQTTEMDYLRWGRELDVVSNDHYLIAAEAGGHRELAFSADLTRGTAGGKPWLLMEHSTSAVNWQPRNRAKSPGEMIRNSLSHVARGADAVLFFQWRASRAGAEKFHSGLLPHAGTDTRQWREVVELSRRPRRGRGGRRAARRATRRRSCSTTRPGGPASSTRTRASTSATATGPRTCTAPCPRRASGSTWSTPTSDLSAYRLVVVPDPLPRRRRDRRRAHGGRGRRGHRGDHLLQRHRRRERPRPPRRLPRRVPRAAGRAHRPSSCRSSPASRCASTDSAARRSRPTPGPRTSSSPAPRRSPRTPTARPPVSPPSRGARSAPGRRGTSRPASTPEGTDRLVGLLVEDSGVATMPGASAARGGRTRRVGADASWLFVINHGDVHGHGRRRRRRARQRARRSPATCGCRPAGSPSCARRARPQTGAPDARRAAPGAHPRRAQPRRDRAGDRPRRAPRASPT